MTGWVQQTNALVWPFQQIPSVTVVSLDPCIGFLIVHEPDNIRVSSGWAKDCCHFLIPIYVHIVY